MEVILPVAITLKGFLTTAFINPLGLFARCKSWIVLSSGRLENDWQPILFPEHKPAWRRELFTIEHHMYAGVPCYKLARVHRAIKHELPYTATGLYETWSINIAILGRQKQAPSYQFVADLPAKAGV